MLLKARDEGFLSVGPGPQAKVQTEARTGTAQVGHPLEHGCGRVWIRNDDRAPCSEHPSLFSADGLPGRSQPALMVQIHGGEQGKVGVDDIHGVEATSEPDLEDG